MTNGELRGLFNTKAQEMYDKGIKRGSFKWIWGNTNYIIELNKKHNLKLKFRGLKFKELFILIIVRIVNWYREL